MGSSTGHMSRLKFLSVEGVCVHNCTYVYVYIYIYMYTRMPLYIYIYTHAYINSIYIGIYVECLLLPKIR